MKNIPSSASIDVSETPNPQAMYFSFPCKLTEEHTHFDFPCATTAAFSPLPKALFASFPMLSGVFISGNRLTLSIQSEENWKMLISDVQAFLLDYFHKGASLTLVSSADHSTSSPAISKEEQVIRETIESTLTEYIRPAIARDGGAVSLVSYKDGCVELELKGACRGCPSSTYTLKAGIERLLMSMIPEVRVVEAIETDSSER